MNNRILFLEDITATGGKVFKQQLKKRLNAKGYNIIQKDFIKQNFNFANLFGKVKINSMIFYINYLCSINSFFNTIIDNMPDNTIFLISGTPLLYNFYKNINKDFHNSNLYAKLIFNNHINIFKDLVSFIFINSYTEIVKDNIQELTKEQQEYYKLFNITFKSENTNKISTIQLIKNNIQEAFMFFRQNKINCIKTNLNFNEDISKNIINILEKIQIK